MNHLVSYRMFTLQRTLGVRRKATTMVSWQVMTPGSPPPSTFSPYYMKINGAFLALESGSKQRAKHICKAHGLAL